MKVVQSMALSRMANVNGFKIKLNLNIWKKHYNWISLNKSIILLRVCGFAPKCNFTHAFHL